MKAATAITYELDDISVATEELISQIKEKITFEEHCVGILYGQADMDIDELSEALHDELGFDIYGGTTGCGGLLANEGYLDIAVMLHVMTASDCFFATAISDDLSENPEQGIIDTYQNALAKLQAQGEDLEPKMVYCVAPLLPNYSPDNTVATLNKVGDSIPIFGFIAADNYEYCNQMVYLNDECYGDRVAMLLIAGNVRPVFDIRTLAGSRTLSKRRVTKAKGSVIYEIDDKPAYEYIAEFPFINDEAGTLFNYQFFVEMKNAENNDGVPVSRVLHTYDKATGEIVCFADVPQDSYIGLLNCDKDDCIITSKTAFQSLREKIEANSQDGYEFSSVFIANCTIRHMFLADERTIDGLLIEEVLPDNLVTSGAYAYGEIAPTSTKGTKAVNRFHNATITMCAI